MLRTRRASQALAAAIIAWLVTSVCLERVQRAAPGKRLDWTP